MTSNKDGNCTSRSYQYSAAWLTEMMLVGKKKGGGARKDPCRSDGLYKVLCLLLCILLS